MSKMKELVIGTVGAVVTIYIAAHMPNWIWQDAVFVFGSMLTMEAVEKWSVR